MFLQWFQNKNNTIKLMYSKKSLFYYGKHVLKWTILSITIHFVEIFANILMQFSKTKGRTRVNPICQIYICTYIYRINLRQKHKARFYPGFYVRPRLNSGLFYLLISCEISVGYLNIKNLRICHCYQKVPVTANMYETKVKFKN